LDEQRQRRIKKITQSIIGLPTLPAVITQMIGLIDNPKTSGRQVAQLIATDQALTAKILKLANSAFYGFPREIATVQHAVVILGFETVKSLGLSVSVLQRFAGPSDNAQFDRQLFWEHSIACGVSARLLAAKLRYRLPGEAFAAGILHLPFSRIGKREYIDPRALPYQEPARIFYGCFASDIPVNPFHCTFFVHKRPLGNQVIHVV